jgi:hypothetical protein
MTEAGWKHETMKGSDLVEQTLEILTGFPAESYSPGDKGNEEERNEDERNENERNEDERLSEYFERLVSIYLVLMEFRRDSGKGPNEPGPN